MATINKEKYLAELTKLLGFMSSWDRQAQIEKYSALFDGAENEEELIERLGTPTRVAVELAADYVSSPPPAIEVFSPEVVIESFTPDGEPVTGAGEAPESGAAAGAEDDSADDIAEQIGKALAETDAEAEDEAEGPDRLSAPKRRARPAVMVPYAIVSVVIGLPIALICVALGIPFIAAGVVLVIALVSAAVDLVPMLALISDKLFATGVTAAGCGLGLALTWLGIWLSLTLCWLWVGKCVFGLGGKICFKKGGDEA